MVPRTSPSGMQSVDDAPSYPQRPVVVQSQNSGPWFAVSMGLMGLILGFAVGNTMHVSGGAAAPVVAGQVVDNTAPTVPTAPTPPPPTGTAPTTGIGPVLGKASATVTVVEFTDFQCPFCGRHFTETFGQIKKNYVDTGKVKYELRMFPLTSIHPNAEPAAEAAMCANKQNKFWEMHDKLFTNQNTWSSLPDASATFKQYAADIGLNASQFSTCLTNHETQADVQKGTADGSAAGINGTPGFWILGPNNQVQQVSGAYPYATFQAAFDKMLGS